MKPQSIALIAKETALLLDKSSLIVNRSTIHLNDVNWTE